MESTRGENVNILRLAACLPGVLAWSLAALASLRWLAALGGGQMTFGSDSRAALLPVMWLLIVLGLPIVGYLAYHTARGRVSVIWQLAIVALGLSAVVVNLGD